MTAESSKTDRLVLHLAAARKLACYLLRNTTDAEDVVQEAYVRALQHGWSADAGDGRAWMLTIVRNVGYDWIRRSRRAPSDSKPIDPEDIRTEALSPEAVLLAKLNVEALRRSLDRLSVNHRMVVILRDLEQMSYKEIAERAEIPLGTVMSRLARGRANLRTLLSTHHCITANFSQPSERSRQTNEGSTGDLVRRAHRPRD
jgi:RNA polymerase sigma factor (sigma-70 family)